MIRLQYVCLAIGLLVFSLVTTPEVSAQALTDDVPEVPYTTTPETETVVTAVPFVSTPVVQELPDHTRVWLDGRVSFVGGELSSSQRQLQFAEARGIPLMRSNDAYQESIRSGRLVELNHPDLEIGARRPFVLPTTARFIYGIAEQFRAAGCGRLRINDALRLTTERPPNGSPYSVHPAGMALDLRIINLDERCYGVLESLLFEAESAGKADVTREHDPPHFHVVVIPEDTSARVFLDAQQNTEVTPDQGD